MKVESASLLPEERCNQHDERNVEREAGAGLVLVHGVGLIGIGRDRTDDDEYRSYKARDEGTQAHVGNGLARDGANVSSRFATASVQAMRCFL